MYTPVADGQDTAAAKHAMRSHAKIVRSSLTEGERNHASGCLAHHASQLPLLMKVPAGGTVAGYFPMGGEIDPLPLLDWLRQLGWRVALPIVEQEGGVLLFRQWEPEIALEVGYHGIRQPTAEAEVCTPDVLLIPLLAFDRQGRRLGYGGGYYDRTLSQYTQDGHDLVSIGVAFSKQEVENVPFDDWDYHLDMILTERGLCRVEAPVSS
jgi:5-formyltetrahydrofolate cyclo-ligase